MYTHIHTYIHTYTYTYVHTQICTYILSCIFAAAKRPRYPVRGMKIRLNLFILRMCIIAWCLLQRGMQALCRRTDLAWIEWCHQTTPCTHIHTHTHTYTYNHRYIHTYTCIHIHTHTIIDTYIHTYIHFCIINKHQTFAMTTCYAQQ